jgi:hypothetical protein
MLAALDALIEAGKGGRTAVALRQAMALMLRVGFEQPRDAVALFDELLATLAMELDDECIRELAPELARIPNVLTAFNLAVASRFQNVSTPPDRRSARRDPVADAANPLTIARRADPEKLEELVRLPVLPDALTAIVAARGHMPAILLALANPGAVFRSATLVMLTELAASDRALRVALAARLDLPGGAFDRLWPLMGREARAGALMAGASVSVETAKRALAEAEAAGRHDGRRPLSQLQANIAAGDFTVSDLVGMLSGEGRIAELASLMAAELGLSAGTTFAMLGARLDHPAAVLVKAMGCEPSALKAVLALRDSRALGVGGDIEGLFDRLETEEAGLIARLVERQHIGFGASAAEDPQREAAFGG